MNISTSLIPSFPNAQKNEYKKRDKKIISEDLFDWISSNLPSRFQVAYNLTLSKESLELYEEEFGSIPDEFLPQ